MTLSPDFTLSAAQRDMRVAYFGGAPGMLTSAAVWTTAGGVSALQSPNHAIWTLFLGGMLIHPLSILFNKLLGRSGQHDKTNALGTLALASTFWMIAMLPLAYVVSRTRLEWFFPAMLLIIGGRYLTFATLFGNRLYWICGAALGLAGFGLVSLNASPTLGAFTGAALEAAFAAILFRTARRELTT